MISLPETLAFCTVSNTIQTTLHVLPADILCTTAYLPPSFVTVHCSGLIDGPSGTPNLLFGIWQLGASQKPCLVQEVALNLCFQIRQHLRYLNRHAACRFLHTAKQKFLDTLPATSCTTNPSCIFTKGSTVL
jgi:hypothetical protein